MSLFLQNLRFAIRRLLRAPLFTIVAVLGSAIGIGANTSVFTVVNGVIFRPLPFENAERLVVVSGYHEQIGRHSVSYPDFVDLRENADIFDHFAAFYQRDFTLTGNTEPERLHGLFVSASFFPMFGAKPALGRFFSSEEEMGRGAAVVVLSNALWRNRFGSSPDILGQNLTLNGVVYSVIGVAPAKFRPPTGAQLWVPLTVSDEEKADRGSRFLRMFAMLKPGVSIKQAQADLNIIARQLEQQYPDTNAGRQETIIPLHEELT